MKEYHLTKWSVGSNQNYYTPPELVKIRLKGIRKEDNKPVITTSIQKVEGRKITTKNSIYYLEDIDPDYLRWLEETGQKYDFENPIKEIKL